MNLHHKAKYWRADHRIVHDSNFHYVMELLGYPNQSTTPGFVGVSATPAIIR